MDIATIRREIRAVLAAGFNLMIEAVTDLAFGDNGKVTAKGIDDQDIEAVVGYHFGFYSRPNDGATGVVVKLGGKGANSVLVAFRDTQYEMSLQKGEVGIQNAFGSTMLFKKDGTIEINGNTYALIKDSILSDLATALGYIPTAASTPYPGLVPNVASWAAFLTKLGNGTYKSTKGKFG